MHTAKQKLLEAINDYPKIGLDSSDELLMELYKNISTPITLEKLKAYSQQIDLSTNAWEAESIASLVELLKEFKNKNLEEVIQLIKQDN